MFWIEYLLNDWWRVYFVLEELLMFVEFNGREEKSNDEYNIYVKEVNFEIVKVIIFMFDLVVCFKVLFLLIVMWIFFSYCIGFFNEVIEGLIKKVYCIFCVYEVELLN